MNKSELLSTLSPMRRAIRLAIGVWRLAPHETLFAFSFVCAHLALAYSMSFLGWEAHSAKKTFFVAPLFVIMGCIGLRLCIQDAQPPSFASCLAIPLAGLSALVLFLALSSPLDPQRISQSAHSTQAILSVKLASMTHSELSAASNAPGGASRDELVKELMAYSNERARHALDEAREANSEKFAGAYAACVLLQTLLFALAIAGLPTPSVAKGHVSVLGRSLMDSLGAAKNALTDKAISDETEWSRIESKALSKAAKNTSRPRKTKSL
jgi:hypothetical protein